MYVVVYHRLRIRQNRKGTLLILSRVIALPSATVVAISCFWLCYIVIRFFSSRCETVSPSSFMSRSVDVRCLVISYSVLYLLFLGD